MPFEMLRCLECNMWGTNLPGDNRNGSHCGNCNSTDTRGYVEANDYDALRKERDALLEIYLALKPVVAGNPSNKTDWRIYNAIKEYEKEFGGKA